VRADHVEGGEVIQPEVIL